MNEDKAKWLTETVIDEMGLSKFLTVVGGVCIGGLITGIVLLNVIPNNPKIIKKEND